MTDTSMAEGDALLAVAYGILREATSNPTITGPRYEGVLMAVRTMVRVSDELTGREILAAITAP